MQEITRTNELSVSVFQQISDLVRYYRTYEHRVDLSQPLRKGETVTKLDKMLRSLNKYIFVDDTIGRAFLSRVQELVVKGFKISLHRGAHSSASFTSTSSRSPVTPLISTSGSSSLVYGKPGGSAFSPHSPSSTAHASTSAEYALVDSRPEHPPSIPISDDTTPLDVDMGSLSEKETQQEK